MGPGPSDVDPAVLRALSAPTIGHLDPAFLTIMDEVRAMLRACFGTQNELTMPMSGTGSAGMETLLVNLLEPGDRALIAQHGVFGGRMAEVARRCGAEVELVTEPFGQPLRPEVIAAAAEGKRFDLIALVHAETSTGVLTDLTPYRSIANRCGALLAIDCVTSLGGVPVELDKHGVDAAYSGTQKCLSCPPGLSPVSLSPRAVAKMTSRDTQVQSWYLDLGLIAQYWGAERAYHHTAPVNMIYALHEALRLALDETLTARFARHEKHAAALRAGLQAMGLALPVAEAHRLDPLTLVSIPAGVNDRAIRSELITRHGLEIGGGLGEFKGKAWRIGLMGSACTARNVLLCLSALRDVLKRAGHAVGDPIPAASAALD